MIRSSMIVVAALATMATPVLAQTPETRTEHVSYAGLDLNSTTGVNILRTRIHRALRRVCESDTVDVLVVERLRQRCMTAAQPAVDAQLAAIGLAPPTSVQVLVAAR